MSNPNKHPSPQDEAESRIPAKSPKQKKKTRRGSFGRFFRRLLLVIFTIAILAAGALTMALHTVFYGPSETARDLLTISLSETAATNWIPGIFLDEEKVAEILMNSGAVWEEG